MKLENDLRRALGRRSPAPGFANRVMARIERDAHPKRPAWWRAVAASVMFAAVIGGYTTHRVVEHRKGMRARAEVLRAMSIASEKVRYAQNEVRSIGSNH